ncbi:PAS domain S-box protein [Halovulum dunhuangense]|uniref:histidine kinase n=1 Tax=Halovulum dunhuangense TaxID=1505036 RepID=A0A849L7R6_9RHOB|nr:PAS domain S-box protein [Halovulum dunhuangense]NNU82081.1 PAS domain S-box protein [Halovulum dunhuangense]
MSLVRLARLALAASVVGWLVIAVVASDAVRRIDQRIETNAIFSQLERDIDRFQLSLDSLAMDGADSKVIAAVQRNGTSIRDQLTELGTAYPEALNGARAINMILDVLDRWAASDAASTSAATDMSRLTYLRRHDIVLSHAKMQIGLAMEAESAAQAKAIVASLSFSGLLFIGTGFILTWLLFRQIDGPVKALTDAMRRMRVTNTPVRAPEHLRNEFGAIGRALNELTDHRRSAELKLRQSQDLLRIAGDMAHLGGWRHDPVTNLVFLSDGAANILGRHTSGSLPLARLLEHCAAEDRMALRKLIERCIGTGQPFSEVIRIETAHGRERWVRAVGEPARGPDGNVTGLQGALQDITDEVLVRTRAERRNAELKNVIASIGDGFFVLNRDWEISFINARARELLRFDDNDEVGAVFWSRFPVSEIPALAWAFHEAMRTGKGASLIEHVAPLGVWFEIHIHPTASGLAVYFHDYTERRAEREQLKLLETASQRSNDVIIITEVGDPADLEQFHIIYVNERFEQITGYSREEAIGRTPLMLQGPKSQPEEIARIRAAIARKEPVRVEMINYTRDGREIWVEKDIVPLTDDDGTVTHVVAVQRDITERRRIEEELRLNEQRFRLATQATNDIIWDWDIAGGSMWVSENHGHILGWDEVEHPEMLTSPLWAIHSDDRTRVEAELHTALNGTGDSWSSEFRLRRRDGGHAIMKVKAFILRDADGQAVRMLGGMDDMTEIRALDAQLFEAQKLDALGQLTGGVAHDFNNLLTIIIGNAALLQDMMDGRPERRLADSMLEAGERAAGLTASLLAFSRQQPLETRPTDVNALIRRSADLLYQAVSENVDLRFDLAAGETTAQVDPTKLQSAILNLVINSQHAIEGEGIITIVTGDIHLAPGSVRGLAPGEYVLLSVSDTGCGMPPDVAERAFEPFFTTKGPGVGTGLGLSTVYGFAQQSGGTALIESRPGAGTTIRIYLPRAEQHAQAEEAPRPDPSPRGRGEHILVVEDDSQLRQHVADAIRKMGYRVSTAERADRALGILEGNDPVDAIFSDIALPGGMNGCNLARRVRESHPGTKILLTTGYSESSDLKDLEDLEDVGVLQKPYRSEALSRALSRLLLVAEDA